MADVKDTAGSKPNQVPPPEDTALDLEPETEQAFLDVLVSGDEAGVRTLLAELHHADVADLLERLNADERARVVEILRDDFEPKILSELDETVRDHVIECLGVENLAAVIAGMESDDALEVVLELDEDEQRQVLDAIPPGDRTLIEEGLTYPEDSAGRLMQREVVTVPESWTVGETIDFLRQSGDSGDDDLPARFYDVFIVDPAHRPVGSLPLSRLLRTRRPVAVADIMDREMKLLPVATDQEDVAYVFRQRDLVSAPVVDDGGWLVGAITIDDVVDVIDEEHEEDIMRLGGVTETDIHEPAWRTSRRRFVWLLVNLATAVLASLVIGLFDASIEQMVALAVLMPIVASMGGNAGTQSLTVTVRALATKDVTTANTVRLIGKEGIVGLVNGVVFASLVGAVTWFWFGDAQLSLVIAAAMVVNMVVAGFSGILIPLGLDRIGIDPAIAATVFLTTVTDVVGFFIFLGLAALVLL
ncbi:MAG: magnesium transporter [Alphaproteobacteria bacterium]